MWLAPSAIPAVPPYARVPEHALHLAADHLEETDRSISPPRLASELARFELEQPALAHWLARALARPLDDVARGFGVAMALTIWTAFNVMTRARLLPISAADCETADQLLATDEDLRRQDARMLVESDDIIAAHQPAIASFLRLRLEQVLESYAEQIDVDDVDAVYRVLLVEVLALSYAVPGPSVPPEGPTGSS